MDKIVRVGTVTAVDGRKARVLYHDLGFTSGWLTVLRHGTSDSWMPDINDTVVVLYLPCFNADGYILGVL